MANSLYLEHHGIKGMRWGIRRFQNKDGSLTPFGRKREKGKDEEESKEETTEERRTRVLSSTDAKEIYKNRDILTTSEIKERLGRIEVEASLAKVAEGTKITAMERVDQIIEVGNKVNKLYELSNTPLGKAIKKQLGMKVEEHLSPDIKKVLANRDKMTDEQISNVVKRATNERTLRKYLADDEVTRQSKFSSDKQESKPKADSEKTDTTNQSAKRSTEDYVNALKKTEAVSGKESAKTAVDDYIKKLHDVDKTATDERIAEGSDYVKNLANMDRLMKDRDDY